MKEFYGDIIIIEKRRIRVSFQAKKKPTKEQMLKILENQEYDDITDEESLEYQQVLEVDLE
jgi:hypothetical protein